MSENWLSFISVIPPQVTENLPTAEDSRHLHDCLLRLRDSWKSFLEELGEKEVATELKVEVTVQTGNSRGLGNKTVLKIIASIVDQARLYTQRERERERESRGSEHYHQREMVSKLWTERKVHD